MHDDDVVLDVFQINALRGSHLLRVDILSTHKILDLLSFLALDKELVSIVSLLIDPVEVINVFDLDKLRNRAFLQNFLTPLLNSFAQMLLHLALWRLWDNL